MSIFGGGSYTGRFPDRKSRLGPLGLAVAVLGGSLGLLVAYHPEVAGQQVKTRYIEVPRCRLQTFRKSAKFLAEAWAVPDESFNVGEPLRLQMRVSSPAYMNVFPCEHFVQGDPVGPQSTDGGDPDRGLSSEGQWHGDSREAACGR